MFHEVLLARILEGIAYYRQLPSWLHVGEGAFRFVMSAGAVAWHSARKTIAEDLGASVPALVAP